jgi:hypothetical protein
MQSRLLELNSFLKKRLVGQDEAVERVCRRLVMASGSPMTGDRVPTTAACGLRLAAGCGVTTVLLAAKVKAIVSASSTTMTLLI